MLSIPGFLLTIALLVFIHEFGHYYIAKSFGVKIEEFSIGFGKELWSRIDKDGTRWKICILPLGGFVKMHGMNRETTPLPSSATATPLINGTFASKPIYARFLIIAAGPVANYLFAIIILTCFYCAFGKTVIPPIIEEVMHDSPAQKAGLQPGDKIIKVNSQQVNDFKDVQGIIMALPNQSLALTFERYIMQPRPQPEFPAHPSGERGPINLSGQDIREAKGFPEIFTTTITPASRSLEKGSNIKVGYIGVKATKEFIHINTGIISSTFEAIKTSINISVLSLKAVVQMLTLSRSSEHIYGAITIAKESGKSLSQGPLDFVLFLAMLSINLGLINLLPIPALDGGHLIFIIYEAIARRPLNLGIQQFLLKLGLMIIFFIIVISTSNDIKSLIF